MFDFGDGSNLPALLVTKKIFLLLENSTSKKNNIEIAYVCSQPNYARVFVMDGMSSFAGALNVIFTTISKPLFFCVISS